MLDSQGGNTMPVSSESHTFGLGDSNAFSGIKTYVELMLATSFLVILLTIAEMVVKTIS